MWWIQCGICSVGDFEKDRLAQLQPSTKSKLTFLFDNCSGQDKNGILLKLVVYLYEMGDFEDVDFQQDVNVACNI